MGKILHSMSKLRREKALGVVSAALPTMAWRRFHPESELASQRAGERRFEMTAAEQGRLGQIRPHPGHFLRQRASRFARLKAWSRDLAKRR